MRQKELVIGDTFRFGWKALRENLSCFIRIMLFVEPIQLLLFLLRWAFHHNNIELYIGIIVISYIVNAFIFLAFVQVGLRFTATGQASFRDLYSAYKRFGSFFICYLIYLLIIIGGLILLIIPGIIWAVKYQFFGYFVIDQKMNPVRAIASSGQLTKGAKGQLFFFDLACIGIMMLGILACFVGLLIATPLIIIAMANVYRHLLTAEKEQLGGG